MFAVVVVQLFGCTGMYGVGGCVGSVMHVPGSRLGISGVSVLSDGERLCVCQAASTDEGKL